MIATIDIGNSNVVFGIYNEGKWSHVWRVETKPDEELMYYELHLGNHLLENGIDPRKLEKTIISSVVPQLNPYFDDLVRLLLKQEPLWLNSDAFPLLPLEILKPNEIGSDIVANCLAAKTLFNQNAIIIDFGTAMTFTAVSGQGKIEGVNIVPGIKTAIHSLFDRTAQLPEVPLEYPNWILGQDTVSAIQSGILIGYVGLIRHMVQSIKTHWNSGAIVLATGGLGAILSPLQREYDHHLPNLTLDGLRIFGGLTTGDC